MFNDLPGAAQLIIASSFFVLVTLALISGPVKSKLRFEEHPLAQILIILIILYFTLYAPGLFKIQNRLMGLNPLWLVTGIGALFLIGGIGYRYSFRRQEYLQWLAARAPLLPMEEVRPGDDCWVSGRIQADSPLVAPHFSIPVAYFWYVLRVTEAERRVIKDEMNAVPFSIEDSGKSFTVSLAEAVEINPFRLDNDIDGQHHTLEYLEVGTRISVLGVVSDDGSHIGPGGHVPLVITQFAPIEYTRMLQNRIHWQVIWSYLLIWFGGALLCPLLFYFMGRVPFHPTTPRTLLFALSGLLPVGIIVCGLLLYSFYNRIILFGNQVRNAWHLIEIDCHHRYELLPQLEQAIKDACAHEDQVLASLAELRSRGDAPPDSGGEEEEIERQLDRVIALKESYPELRTNENFHKLFQALVTLEEKIAYDRTFYNETVAVHNKFIQSFPQSLVAAVAGIEPFPFWKAS